MNAVGSGIIRASLRGLPKKMVPGGGLEPPHLVAADFESAASTDSAIPAREGRDYRRSRRVTQAPRAKSPFFRQTAPILGCHMATTLGADTLE